MNKKDLIMIARALYLQQTISRQLFAKFDFTEEINENSGSFARLSQALQSVFFGFIGSKQRTPYPQIIQKNGMMFKIHKLNLDNSVSDQIYNNTQYNIDKLAFILRKLYVTISQGGVTAFKQKINNIQKLWKKVNAEKLQTIIDDLQRIKQVFTVISDFVVGDIQYIQDIRNLQEQVSKLKTEDIKTSPQYSVVDGKIKNFIQKFRSFVSMKKSYVQVIDMAMNRLKSFVQLYKDLKQSVSYNQEDELLKQILQIFETCNTNTEISEQLRRVNVKQHLGVNYDHLVGQDDSLSAFIRFIKNIDNAWIKEDNLNNAIDYYLDLPQGVISKQAIQCLQQLRKQNEVVQEQLIKIQDNKQYSSKIAPKESKEGILDSANLSQQLKNKIKSVKQQLI